MLFRARYLAYGSRGNALFFFVHQRSVVGLYTSQCCLAVSVEPVEDWPSSGIRQHPAALSHVSQSCSSRNAN